MQKAMDYLFSIMTRINEMKRKLKELSRKEEHLKDKESGFSTFKKTFPFS
jgi:hypothetical protein